MHLLQYLFLLETLQSQRPLLCLPNYRLTLREETLHCVLTWWSLQKGVPPVGRMNLPLNLFLDLETFLPLLDFPTTFRKARVLWAI